jgi:predicted HTH domain antitoxin
MINIKCPEYLANILRLSVKDLELELKTSSLAKLFELGKVSYGVAVKVLGISRLHFFELLTKYNVSALSRYAVDDLSEDIANA